MADRKTHLRELSVLVYLEKSIDSSLKPAKITPNDFIQKLQSQKIKNATTITFGQISSSNDQFNDDEKFILENGYKLAELIRNKLKVVDSHPKSWVGSLHNSRGKIKHDIEVGGYKISLKENSEIFDNMGLYRFCNILEGESKYKRGKLHIFTEFAKDEFNQWFAITRDLAVAELLKGEKIFEHPGKYKSKISLKDKTLIMQIKYEGKLEDVKEIPDFSGANYFDHFEPIHSKFKEHVFAKLISKFIENNTSYTDIKNKCSMKAGAALVDKYKSKENTILPELSELICLKTEKYFYGKVTEYIAILYEVPPASDHNYNKIKIKSLDVNVPESQCNIFTKITRDGCGSELTLRSEIRYSHGQFKGIPEAKLYHSDGDLSDFWKKL